MNEEAGHIVFHTAHVEHDMNDNTGETTMRNTTNANGEQTEIVIENANTEAEAEGVEGTSTETMLNDAEKATGGTNEEYSELGMVNEESDHIVGEKHQKTHRGVKNHTQRRETMTKRSEQMQDIQRRLEDFKGVKSIPRIKSAKKRVLITKMKNEKGEIITSRKRTANTMSLVNSTKIIRRQCTRRN